MFVEQTEKEILASLYKKCIEKIYNGSSPKSKPDAQTLNATALLHREKKEKLHCK